MDTTKRCSACRQFKPRAAFHKNKAACDGLNNQCKECRKRYNPEANERAKRYAANHREQERQRAKTWYEANRDRGLGARRRYASVHRAETRARAKQWRTDNPERYHNTHKANTARRRARQKQANGSFTAQEWRETKERYEHKCLCCGRQEPVISLTPDHVIPLANGGSNAIENIQPLCLRCNLKKGTATIDWRPYHSR